MIGSIQKDLVIPAASGMTAFGGSTLYRQDIARPGQVLPPTLNAVPRPSVANIYNMHVIQVNTQLPAPNKTPVTTIKSNYAFLPIGQQNKAGR